MKGACTFPGRELPATTITRHLSVFTYGGSGWIVCQQEIAEWGVLGSPVNPMIPAVVQERTPEAVLGRVNGVVR